MLQQKLKQLQAKKQQRGLTLLETMLVIAIIALFAGAILYLYLSVKSDQEVQQETTNITKIIGKVESAYKRRFNVKDSGKIFPGHGGVLDRFDSTFFAMFMFQIVLKFIGTH